MTELTADEITDYCNRLIRAMDNATVAVTNLVNMKQEGARYESGQYDYLIPVATRIAVNTSIESFTNVMLKLSQ